MDPDHKSHPFLCPFKTAEGRLRYLKYFYELSSEITIQYSTLRSRDIVNELYSEAAVQLVKLKICAYSYILEFLMRVLRI